MNNSCSKTSTYSPTQTKRQFCPWKFFKTPPNLPFISSRLKSSNKSISPKITFPALKKKQETMFFSDLSHLPTLPSTRNCRLPHRLHCRASAPTSPFRFWPPPGTLSLSLSSHLKIETQTPKVFLTLPAWICYVYFFFSPFFGYNLLQTNTLATHNSNKPTPFSWFWTFWIQVLRFIIIKQRPLLHSS